jgi:hypothetical protein
MLTKYYSQRRFTILLIAALVLIGARLSIAENVAEEVLMDLVSAALISVGLLALCDERRHRFTALMLGCPAVLLGVVSHGFPDEVAGNVHLASRVFAMLFLGFAAIILIRTVITARAVTWETISAALVGYLMIGIIWTHVFCTVELLQPGSFKVPHSLANPLDDAVERQAVLEYFSFATLSTVGYGDVTPISRPARSLACIEAICGQFYLAVLVAGLVGMRGIRPESSQ